MSIQPAAALSIAFRAPAAPARPAPVPKKSVWTLTAEKLNSLFELAGAGYGGL